MLRSPSDLHLPPSQLVRGADQRATLGRFCFGASAFLVSGRIEQQTVGKFQVSTFRRKLVGVELPIVYALVEQDESGGNIESWQAAEAMYLALADRRDTDIIKVYFAGRARDDRLSGIADHGYYGAYFPLPIPEALVLGSSYERFLNSLGNHTRRDMRRLRRQAAELGFTFELQPATHTDAGERHVLGRANRPRPYRAWKIDAADNFLADQETGFRTLLRAPSGELLSCCAGFISDGSAVVLYQLNDGAHQKASISLTHRAFLIEHLIEQGIGEILFPGGAAGLLATACQIRMGGELVLIRRSAAALIKSGAIMAVRPGSRVGVAFRRIAAAKLGAGLGTQIRTLAP